MPRIRRSARPARLPRLRSQEKRLPGYSALPPLVREDLDAIARREGWSRSRVMAYLVCDWFDLDAATGEPQKVADKAETRRLLKRR